jgi:hypothetical protein
LNWGRWFDEGLLLLLLLLPAAQAEGYFLLWCDVCAASACGATAAVAPLPLLAAASRLEACHMLVADCGAPRHCAKTFGKLFTSSALLL